MLKIKITENPERPDYGEDNMFIGFGSSGDTLYKLIFELTKDNLIGNLKSVRNCFNGRYVDLSDVEITNKEVIKECNDLLIRNFAPSFEEGEDYIIITPPKFKSSVEKLPLDLWKTSKLQRANIFLPEEIAELLDKYTKEHVGFKGEHVASIAIDYLNKYKRKKTKIYKYCFGPVNVDIKLPEPVLEKIALIKEETGIRNRSVIFTNILDDFFEKQGVKIDRKSQHEYGKEIIKNKYSRIMDKNTEYKNLYIGIFAETAEKIEDVAADRGVGTRVIYNEIFDIYFGKDNMQEIHKIYEALDNINKNIAFLQAEEHKRQFSIKNITKNLLYSPPGDRYSEIFSSVDKMDETLHNIESELKYLEDVSINNKLWKKLLGIYMKIHSLKIDGEGYRKGKMAVLETIRESSDPVKHGKMYVNWKYCEKLKKMSDVMEVPMNYLFQMFVEDYLENYVKGEK